MAFLGHCYDRRVNSGTVRLTGEGYWEGGLYLLDLHRSSHAQEGRTRGRGHRTYWLVSLLKSW